MFAARGGFTSSSEGGDPYWSSVTMLIQANSGTIVDYALGATITPNYTSPGSSLVTSPILYSAYSIQQTGGARWQIAANAARTSPGQFTFEWFYRCSGASAATTYEVPWYGPNVISQIGTTNSNKWIINGIAGAIFSDSNAYDLQWHHVAFTRDSSNVLRFFYDGVERVASSSTSATSYTFGNAIQFGGAGASDNYSNGNWDQIRLTTGVCRYTSSFTPPTGLFPTY